MVLGWQERAGSGGGGGGKSICGFIFIASVNFKIQKP